MKKKGHLLAATAHASSPQPCANMIEAVMILAPSSKALLLKAIIALAAKHSAGSEGDTSGSTGKQRVLLGGYNVNNVRSMAVAAVHGNAVRHRVVVAVEVVTDEIRTRDTPFKNSRCPAQGK